MRSLVFIAERPEEEEVETKTYEKCNGGKKLRIR